MRFLSCSARVHSLGVPKYLDCHPEEYKLICTIIEHNGNCTFLPSLRKLRWALRDGNGLFPPQFAPQALHSLSFTHSGANPTPAQGDLVLQYTPFIRTLSICSDWLVGLAGPTSQSIVDIALSLKYLESLRIWEADESMPLTPPDLQRLGASPTITDLDVYITSFQDTRDQVELPRMRRLRLVGLAVNVSSLLRRIQAPSLLELELGCMAITATGFVHLMTDLGGSPVSGNLRSLFLSPSRSYGSEVLSDPDAVWFLSTLLRPCVNMVKLKRFELDSIPWENVITDSDDIREIAKCLPNTLRRLSLPHLNYPPSPPLTLLWHFAHHCPNLVKLEFLALSLDSVSCHNSFWCTDCGKPSDMVTDAGTPLDPIKVRGHPLRTFRAGDMERQSLPEGMEREDVEAIGEYLHSLFPKLDMVRMRDLVKRNRPPTDRCLDSGYYVVLNAIEAARERQLRRDVGE